VVCLHISSSRDNPRALKILISALLQMGSESIITPSISKITARMFFSRSSEFGEQIAVIVKAPHAIAGVKRPEIEKGGQILRGKDLRLVASFLK
jgi:hypothetical protein